MPFGNRETFRAEVRSTPGCLIAMCGIDGSGKTLQCSALESRARAGGRRVERIAFPRYDEGFFGKLVARYLRGEFALDPQGVSPYLAALPFACDRWQAAPQLRAWLEGGAVVICDRYVAANLAHQGAKIEREEERLEFARWIEELEYDVFALPRPDLQVLLDVPPPLAARLIAAKGERAYLENGKDIHESSMPHLQATYEAYSRLAQGPGWVRIDCAPGGEVLPPEQIAQAVWDAVSPLLDAAGPSAAQERNRSEEIG